MVVRFQLNESKFTGLNGEPGYRFSPSTSFVVECETQDEIDFYWEKLVEDGNGIMEESMPDPKRSTGMVQAFLKISKFSIEILLNI